MFRPIAFGIVAAPALLAAQGILTVHVDQPLHPMPKGFYGLMTEEINHSYDGGLYGELLRDRALKDDPNAPAHWIPVGTGGTVEMIEDPVPGSALTRCLDIQVSHNGVGWGVANDGFWGVPVRSNTTYRASFYVEGGSETYGPLAVSIESSDGTKVWATARTARIDGPWHKVEVLLRTGSIAVSQDNRFVIRSTAPGGFRLAGFSLFGPTYKKRANGNRPDLMEMLAGLRPSFLRLPGGNYLEGNTVAERFDWKATLGRNEDRKGHQAPWGYRSSDGMGLMEFLDWCEDLRMKPLLAVFAGYALRGEHVEPGPALAPFVQDALDEIEFVTGDARTTKWGAERARLGHPKPFPLEYVEIGNEDNFDRSGSYDGRFAQFHDAIKAKYPKLQTIATMPVRSRVPDVVDDHYYRTAAQMAGDSQHYRNGDRKGPKIFVGEWASLQGEPTPDFQAALGDAAWLTGLERDSDLVVMEAYAPLFTNLNPGAAQWNTNLIGYDALRCFGSPSYWVQALFAQNTGDTVLPVEIATTKPAEAFGYRGGVGVAGEGAEYVGPRLDGQTLPPLRKWTHGEGTGMTLEATPLPEGDGSVQLTGRNPSLVAGDPSWTDLDFTVLTRKPVGDRGSSVRFHVTDSRNYWQWNVGGATNEIRHQEVFSNRVVAKGEPVAVLSTGGYTTLRLEVKGGHIRGYVDGKLAIEADENAPTFNPVYASATQQGGETILKVVNLSATDTALFLDLAGSKAKIYALKGSVMIGALGAKSTLDQPPALAPKRLAETTLRAGEPYRFLAHSVTVLRIKAR